MAPLLYESTFVSITSQLEVGNLVMHKFPKDFYINFFFVPSLTVFHGAYKRIQDVSFVLMHRINHEIAICFLSNNTTNETVINYFVRNDWIINDVGIASS